MLPTFGKLRNKNIMVTCLCDLDHLGVYDHDLEAHIPHAFRKSVFTHRPPPFDTLVLLQLSARTCGLHGSSDGTIFDTLAYDRIYFGIVQFVSVVQAHMD